AVRRVRRRGRDPRAIRAALVDAFLEDLALLVLAVERELVGVLRRVQLADGRIDADLAEQTFHAEPPGLVGHDRHDPRADALVAHERGQDPDERDRRRKPAIAARLELALEELEFRYLGWLDARAPFRVRATELLAVRFEVLHLLAVFGRLVVREVANLL